MLRQASDQDGRSAGAERRGRRLWKTRCLVKGQSDRRIGRIRGRLADERRGGGRASERCAMHDATDVAVPRRTWGRRGISGKRSGSLAKADRVGEEARTASAERNADSEALQNKQIGDEQRDCRRTVLRCFDFAARAHSPSKLFTDLVKVNGDAARRRRLKVWVAQVRGSKAPRPPTSARTPFAPRWSRTAPGALP